MSQYLLLLFWIGFIAFLANHTQSKCKTRVFDSYRLRTIFSVALIGFLPVIIVAGSRSFIGDTYGYMHSFSLMPDTFSELSEYMLTVKKDQGFYFCSALIRILLGSDVKVYLYIIAIIQGFCLITVYRRYSTSYFISIFLFIASTDMISWMFNGIRQFVAVTIVFAGTTLMLRKRYLASALVILFAATFHGTAILMLPVIFIVQGKALNWKTLVVTGLCLVFLVFAEQFTNVLDVMLTDTQYENVVSDWKAWEDDGTNPLRVLVYSVPTVLSLIGLRYIRRANDPVINFCTNMSFISTSIYIVSMATSGVFIGRLPIYFSLYNYILLPWELDHIFARSTSRLFKLLMISFYILFYIYQMRLYGLV